MIKYPMFIFALAVLLSIFTFQVQVLAQEGSPVPTPTPIIDVENPPLPPTIPAELPGKAVEAFNLVVLMVASLFAGFAGFVGFTLTKILKEHVPWLSVENRQKLGTGLTRALIFLFNTLVGAGVAWAMPHIAQLDTTGLWGAIVTLVSVVGLPIVVGGSPVFAELWHRLSKIS